MENPLLQKLAYKKITKKELLRAARKDSGLVPTLLEGVSSSKATVRYGCAKVLMDLSEESPERLYTHMDFFASLLDSKYRILTWNAMAIIANLTKVDVVGRFEAIFDKYYGFLGDPYMVTVANVVGHSGEIALAKPHLVDRITDELLKVENVSITPHLTEECRKVIIEKAIKSFDVFFSKVKQKEKVLSLVERHVDDSRKTLQLTAKSFLQKWKWLSTLSARNPNI